jgi:hypothetical protein
MAKSPTRSRFDAAYTDARSNGEKTFEFEGKSYNTRMAGENSSAYNKTLSAGGRNKARSSEDISSGEEIRAAGRAKTVESEDMFSGSDMVVSADKPEAMTRKRETSSDAASEKEAAQKAEGMSRQKAMAEGFKSSRELIEKAEESRYRKGGMVSMKGGGSVRGAGLAQRGQGKIRIC